MGDIDREEIVPHNLHQFSNPLQDDMFSHEHEIEMNNQEAESSQATIISDCYKYEYFIALAIKHEDQLSFSQISLEIIEVSPQQLLVLQTDEIGNSHETGHI